MASLKIERHEFFSEGQQKAVKCACEPSLHLCIHVPVAEFDVAF